MVDALFIYKCRFTGDKVSVRLMTSMFDALDALYDRAGSGRNIQQLPAAYVAFRSRLEDHLAESHQVADHARTLGYSARTISRACLAVTGQTAKQVLIDRLVLEAKRLLVHTDLTAAAIGAQIGFSEPTNFHRFFKRHVGNQPAAFRRYR